MTLVFVSFHGTADCSWPSCFEFHSSTADCLSLVWVRAGILVGVDQLLLLAFMPFSCTLQRFCASWNCCTFLSHILRFLRTSALIFAYLDQFTTAKLRRCVLALHIDFAETLLNATAAREGWAHLTSFSVKTPPLASWTTGGTDSDDTDSEHW